jgi:hypothetical protein
VFQQCCATVDAYCEHYLRTKCNKANNLGERLAHLLLQVLTVFGSRSNATTAEVTAELTGRYDLGSTEISFQYAASASLLSQDPKPSYPRHPARRRRLSVVRKSEVRFLVVARSLNAGGACTDAG